jgi:hypothetical protein
MLLTASSIVALVLTLIAAAVAIRAADQAGRHAQRLGGLRARVFELDAALEQLAHQHRKLQGRFYGTLGQKPADVVPLETRVDANMPPCENWDRAKIEGPTSEAAGCQCDYCTAMRWERHNAKAALVPKGVASRINGPRPT